jgi:glutathionylspermidine synthase
MKRIPIEPRDNWKGIVESQGFHFHSPDDRPYWDESAYYHLTSAEIDTIETATAALDEMCLKAVDHVIETKRFEPFQIPLAFVPMIVQSWRRDEVTLYGRFDLAYDGVSPPKLLEYNADTPTSLLEQAVVQWFWFKDRFPDRDQFNSTHDRLIEAFRRLLAETKQSRLHFTCVETSLEDFMTTGYLRDVAIQAGFDTEFTPLPLLGFNHRLRRFVDQNDRPVDVCFKLYPWEWMVREEFSKYLLLNTTRWLEAPWKMLLSNKAILPVLYELFPESPYLLRASHDPLRFDIPQVRKPILSREGANVAVMLPGKPPAETEGPYGPPYVYQEYHPLPTFDGHHPVIGSWMINGHPTGIGIREDTGLVTGNTSRFVPHIFS